MFWGRCWAYCRHIATSLLLLLAAGCADDHCGVHVVDGHELDGVMCQERLQAELSISSGFTPDQQAEMVAAGELWREATGGRVALSWRVVDGSADIAPRELRGMYAATEADGSTAVTYWLRGAQLRLLMVHELGHRFGLGHGDPGEAMHVDATSPITPADMARFERLWAERR